MYSRTHCRAIILDARIPHIAKMKGRWKVIPDRKYVDPSFMKRFYQASDFVIALNIAAIRQEKANG